MPEFDHTECCAFDPRSVSQEYALRGTNSRSTAAPLFCVEHALCGTKACPSGTGGRGEEGRWRGRTCSTKSMYCAAVGQKNEPCCTGACPVCQWHWSIHCAAVSQEHALCGTKTRHNIPALGEEHAVCGTTTRHKEPPHISAPPHPYEHGRWVKVRAPFGLLRGRALKNAPFSSTILRVTEKTARPRTRAAQKEDRIY